MGGTSSKTTVDILNSVAVSASMRTVQSCTTAASQNQLIQLQAVGDVTLGDINQNQGVSVNTECLFSTAKKNEMAASMSNDIVAKLSASSEGFFNISTHFWEFIMSFRAGQSLPKRMRWEPMLLIIARSGL